MNNTIYEGGVEYLSDEDNDELQGARENLKALNSLRKKIKYSCNYRSCGLTNKTVGEGEAMKVNHGTLNSVGKVKSICEVEGKEGEKGKGKLVSKYAGKKIGNTGYKGKNRRRGRNRARKLRLMVS